MGSLKRLISGEINAKQKRIFSIIAAILAVILCVCMVLGIAAAKKRKTYTHAVELFEQGEYSAAAELFDSLGNYRGASEYARLARSQEDYYNNLYNVYGDDYNDYTEPSYYDYEDISDEYSDNFYEYENSELKKAYDEAIKLKNNGEYAKAAIAFGKIKDYNDARKQSFACWDKVPHIRRTMCWTNERYYSIMNDGTVATEYSISRGVSGKRNGDTFRLKGNFISVQCNNTNFFGLKDDGTISVLGEDFENSHSDYIIDDPYQVEAWTDIVAIFYKSTLPKAGIGDCFVGLKIDGTLNVLVCDYSAGAKEVAEQWTDIVSVSISGGIMALKSDGTCEVYSTYSDDNSSEIYKWTNIKAIGALRGSYFGIKTDGTVKYIDSDSIMKNDGYNFSEFTDIVDLYNGATCIGLKSDGTLVFASDFYTLDPAKSWTDIKDLAGYGGILVGMKNDGSFVYSTSGEKQEYLVKYINLKNKKIIDDPIMF